MNLKEFLKKILPSSGYYYTVQITSGDNVRQFKHDNISQAVHSLQAINSRHHNAYIATGSFKKNRTKSDVSSKRVLYADIDCKEGGQYPTKIEAIQAIKTALKNGLPQFSIMVDSGHGYHLYWVCTEDISKGDWLPYAKALENACKQTNLNIDAGITTDSARILRAPETINVKYPDNPIACNVALETTREYTFDELAKAFNAFLTTPASVSNFIDNSDLGAGLEIEGRPASAALMVELCPSFKHALEVGGAELPGVLWHKHMHTLAYCEDGHDYIHKISEKHDTYDYDKVERRFAYSVEERKNKGAGPTTCVKIAEHCTKCADCEFKGQFKSPIKLAYGKPNPLPWPWRNGDKTLERYDEDDGWIRALRYKVEDLKAAVIPGEETYITFTLGGMNVSTELSVTFTDNRSLQGLLARYALPLDTYELEEIKRLMNAWIQQLRANKQITNMVKHCGWVNNGFQYAKTYFRDDGKEVTGFSADKVMDANYTPKGELAPVLECINHILSQDRIASHCILAASFGAPLLKFTGVPSIVMVLASAASGTAKSTTFKVAQSIWGDPRALSSLDDTTNSIAQKLGYLRNLPAFWDEVKDINAAENITKFFFRITQGTDKGRLTSQLKQRGIAVWDTILMVATNDSMRDMVEQAIGNSDAGAARIFEMQADTVRDTTMNDAEARHFYGRLNDNFGEPGLIYAKYLAEHKDEVKKLVCDLDSAFSSKFKTQGDERFWTAVIAATVIGASLAKKLGLGNFDVRKISTHMTNVFHQMRSGKAAKWQTPAKRILHYVNSYMLEKTESIVRAEKAPARGKHQPAILPPFITKHPVVGRINVDDNTVWLARDPFEKWLYITQGANYSSLIEELIRMGAKHTRGTPGSGLAYQAGGRVPLIEIPLNKPELSNLAGWATKIEEYVFEDEVDNSDLG